MYSRKALAVAALPVLITGLTALGPAAGQAVASGAPLVASSAATDLTSSSATLNGSITPNGIATTYEFEYGTSTAYGTTIPDTPVSAGKATTAVLVSLSLGGLEPGTTYHYQLVGFAGSQTYPGGDETFKTPAATPLVSTGRASSHRPAAATVIGTVNAGGGRTEYFVQYYSVKGKILTSRARTLGARNSLKGVSVGLSKLASSTWYHYRLVAKNSAGTARGRWRSLRTRGAVVAATFTG